MMLGCEPLEKPVTAWANLGFPGLPPVVPEPGEPGEQRLLALLRP